MKTYLLVKLSLVPALWFWTVMAMGHSDVAIFGGALLGIGFVAFNRVQGRARPMETAMMAFLVMLALARLTGFAVAEWAVAGSFVVQGLTGLVTCWLGRPWTSAYAAAQYEEARHSPIFHAVNMVLSLLWAGVFLLTAALGFTGHGALILPITLAGAVVSIGLPPLVVRLALKRAIAARTPYHWVQPPLGGAAGGDDVDVAVIGAGLGGLTTAALLAQAGLKVVVAEQHNLPGGYAHCWLRKARVKGKPAVFRFDSGVHDVSGVHETGPVTRLLARVGAMVEWVRLTQAMEDGVTPIPHDWRDYARLLGKQHPADAAAIMRFFESVKQLYDGLFSTGANNSGVPLPPATPQAMMAFAKAQPLVVRWMEQPFSALMAAHGLSVEAQTALMALAGYVTDDDAKASVLDMVPLFGYYFHGGFYPRGGSGVLGEQLAEAVTRHGGTVLLKTAVEQIIIEEGRACGIRLAGGGVIRARAVISNADLKRTLTRLLPAHAPLDETARAKAAAEPATSAFMVHLGLDRQPPCLPVVHAVGGGGLRVGIVAPSVVDANAAPSGCGTLELIALMPHPEALGWFADADAVDDKALRQSDAYHARKTAMAERMIDAAATLMPELRQWIVHCSEASPLTFSRYDHASAGAIYGVAKSGRLRGEKGPLPGLWLVGAGAAGPGVEAVMISGARAAEALVPGLLAKG